MSGDSSAGSSTGPNTIGGVINALASTAGRGQQDIGGRAGAGGRCPQHNAGRSGPGGRGPQGNRGRFGPSSRANQLSVASCAVGGRTPQNYDGAGRGPQAFGGRAGGRGPGVNDGAGYAVGGRGGKGQQHSGSAVLEVPTTLAAVQFTNASDHGGHAAAQPSPAASNFQASSVAAKMFGFPPNASSSAVMTSVQLVMATCVPSLRYRASSGMTVDGLPMATITFPNLESAKWAVQQIDGKQLGNLHLALRLEKTNGSHAAEHHLQLDSRSAQQGWNAAQPGVGAPTSQNSSAAGPNLTQHHVQLLPLAPSQAAGDGQGWGATRVPSAADQGRSVVASVQQCTDRPALVKLIHRHLVGYEGKPLRELEDLRIKLRSMKVRLSYAVYVPTSLLHGIFPLFKRPLLHDYCC